MTRFEQIASAFPLHAQRIAEATYQCGGDLGMEYLYAEARGGWDAGDALAGAFSWHRTPEGFLYWRDLALGARTP